MTDFELDDFNEDICNAERQTGIVPEAAHESHGEQSESGEQTRGSDAQRPEGEIPGHKQGLGLFAGISNGDYHSGGGVSSTELKQQLRCPKYHRAYATGELVFEPTKQMRLGSAVHVLSLEPLDFDNQVALLPKKAQGNAKNAKENRAEFEDWHEGKVIIHIQEMDTVKYMRDALMEHPEAGELLMSPERQVEMSGYYIDKPLDDAVEGEYQAAGTYMLCKFRPDIRLPWCIGDIKSTNDASEEAFSRTIGNFGYDVSAAHYLEGDRHTSGTDHEKFFFLCVESMPPYLVAIYWLDSDGLKVGYWRRRKALYSIKQCRKNKHWPGYNNDEVKSISVPRNLIYLMEQEQ